MSRLIYYITSSFSTIDTLVVAYRALVRSKPESASVAWNFVTWTDSSETERVQREFAYFSILNSFLSSALINAMLFWPG
jgi:hypothetical protein